MSPENFHYRELQAIPICFRGFFVARFFPGFEIFSEKFSKNETGNFSGKIVMVTNYTCLEVTRPTHRYSPEYTIPDLISPMLHHAKSGPYTDPDSRKSLPGKPAKRPELPLTKKSEENVPLAKIRILIGEKRPPRAACDSFLPSSQFFMSFAKRTPSMARQ